MENNEYHKVPTLLFEGVIKLIEEYELELSYSTRSTRSLEDIVESNDMPTIYYELLAIKS